MSIEILAVEPDVALRRLLDVALRVLGPVTAVPGVVAARAVMEVRRFDVVVTDMRIGHLGYSWIDEVVGIGIPTVVVTAHALDEELTAINAAAGVVIKPFHPRALRTEVQCRAASCGG